MGRARLDELRSTIDGLTSHMQLSKIVKELSESLPEEADAVVAGELDWSLGKACRSQVKLSLHKHGLALRHAGVLA